MNKKQIAKEQELIKKGRCPFCESTVRTSQLEINSARKNTKERGYVKAVKMTQ